MMKKIENGRFVGERALFKTDGAIIENCWFGDGESPLKESANLRISNTEFAWKYPLWYCDEVVVSDCVFREMARAGIWYTKNIRFENVRFECPKAFRRCENLALEDCEFLLGEETLWGCRGVHLRNVVENGQYFGMNAADIDADHLTIEGNYAFDGCKNLRIRNSVLHTKDAFWNCENVVVEDSEIVGEYFGWNSRNITLIRCRISSHQGFCYIKNLTLIDCEVVDSDLCFEYCENIEATILTKVDSIKNPLSGRIVCAGYDELILDDCDPSKTVIEVKK